MVLLPDQIALWYRFDTDYTEAQKPQIVKAG